MIEYDCEPDGLYFVYGANVLPDGSKDRHHVVTVDVLDVAKAGADNATKAYDYCYVKQFGVGTVYFSRMYADPSKPNPPEAASAPESMGSIRP